LTLYICKPTEQLKHTSEKLRKINLVDGTSEFWKPVSVYNHYEEMHL